MPKGQESARAKELAAAKTTTGVLDYLQKVLPRRKLLDLYQDESRGRFVCRSVLQRLSAVAQQIVVRLSCTGGSFPLSGVQVWTALRPNKQQQLFRELYKWAILQEDVSLHIRQPPFSADTAPVGPTPEQQKQLVTLTKEFEKGLLESLRSLEVSPWTPLTDNQVRSLEQEAKEKSVTITTEDLEHYTQEQWDAVLHFLVGTVGKKEPPAAVVHFLLQTNLMQADPDYKGEEDDAPLVITQKGYDFMLQDNHNQVWHFIVQVRPCRCRSAQVGRGCHFSPFCISCCSAVLKVG